LALITPLGAVSTLAAEAVTRNQVLERFLRETGLGTYGIATGGSTTTVIDTAALLSSQLSNDIMPGAWARIGLDAAGAGAAPEGETQPVSAYVATTGTVTNAAFTTAVAVGDHYQFWRYLHPKMVLDTLDSILADACYQPAWTFLTNVPDGDMESVTAAASWTAGANAAITKQTGDPAMWGKRYLRVVNTAANANAYQRFTLAPGRQYHFSVLGRNDQTIDAASTPQLIIYDRTNSAVLSTTTGNVNGADVRLWSDFSTPSTCYEVEARLSATGASARTHWDEAVFFSYDDRDIPLPSWVREKAQVKGLFRTTWDSVGTNLYASMPQMQHDARRFDIMDGRTTDGRLWAVSHYGALDSPVLMFGTRPEIAFTSDTQDTRRIDANWLNAALCCRVFGQLLNGPSAGPLDTDWIQKQYTRWEKEYAIQKRSQEQRLADVIRSAQPMMQFYSRPLTGNFTSFNVR
jgi:hypothetical protein